MTEHLDKESREAIVKYRIEKSIESLDEASLLANSQHYDSAVARLYYACYYIASALLIKNNVEASTHAGVKRMLSLKFVQPGLINPSLIRTYSNLMQGRQLSDYEDFIYQNEESFKEYKEKAIEFCNAINLLLSI